MKITGMDPARRSRSDPLELIGGYAVRSRDGSIAGEVDLVQFETRRIVVSSRRWLLPRRTIIPASEVLEIDIEDRSIRVDRTLDGIRTAPRFVDWHASEEPYFRLWPIWPTRRD